MDKELQDILSRVDHTLLAQGATWKEIKAICDDGIKYGCASVCIPASYVKQAAEYVAGRIPVCTVIGFPNGGTERIYVHSSSSSSPVSSGSSSASSPAVSSASPIASGSSDQEDGSSLCSTP